MIPSFTEEWYTLNGWAIDNNRVEVKHLAEVVHQGVVEQAEGVELMCFVDDNHEVFITLNDTQADDLRRWLNRRAKAIKD